MKNKKYVIIGLMALVSVLMTGCYVNEPSQPRFHKMNIDFDVPQSAWAYDAMNGWFSYYYQTKDLTTAIYDYGTWTMSHEYNPGKENSYLIQLPEFFFNEIQLTDSTSYYYTQRLDYEVGVGYIRVYVTNSDYIYDDWVPDAMHFHMQIVY